MCEWKSDSTHVVLECPDENEQSKATSDSDRCPWSQLLQEMEDNGIVNPSINSHELVAPLTDGGRGLSKLHHTVGSSKCTTMNHYPSLAISHNSLASHHLGDQRYIIKPKPTPIYFQYSPQTQNLKYTNCANAFSTED